jgi:hypothetical protein
MSDHGPFEEMAALAALDAIDGADAVAFDVHRRECLACTRALLDYARVAEGLAPGGAAPETLKARVASRLPRSASRHGLLISACVIFAVISFLQMSRLWQLDADLHLQRQQLEAQREQHARDFAFGMRGLRRELDQAARELALLRQTERKLNARVLELTAAAEAKDAELKAVQAQLDLAAIEIAARSKEVDALHTSALAIAELMTRGNTKSAELKGQKGEAKVWFNPEGRCVYVQAKDTPALGEGERLVLWMIAPEQSPLAVADIERGRGFGFGDDAPAAMAGKASAFAISIETSPRPAAPNAEKIILQGGVR